MICGMQRGRDPLGRQRCRIPLMECRRPAHGRQTRSELFMLGGIVDGVWKETVDAT